MADKNHITVEKLREVLAYDAVTGIFTWRVALARQVKVGYVAGTIQQSGYRYIRVFGRDYRAHRLAWLHSYGEWPKYHIDHIDGNRDNNRLSNIRDVTRSVNQQNLHRARADNKSCGLLGVSWNERNKKWVSQITFPIGKSKHLGYFSTPESAHEAYISAKRKLHLGCTL